jgi:hypothetical protein
MAGGMLAHQIFGLTDAFILGTKPGVLMWLLVGTVAGFDTSMGAANKGSGS